MSHEFQVVADFKPMGDQPAAIDALCAGLEKGQRFQTLEGVTGSGKTFTMANVIERYNRPTLVVSHNKTLAAQLYSELKQFLPNNAVSYFVSYFDYYQPEAYIPGTDTFIEKDSSINEEIERLRLAATDALLNRNDVVIVASVSCIYGLGSPESYKAMLVEVERGHEIDRDRMLEQLVDIQYNRNEMEKAPGTFRVRGDSVDIFPSYNEEGIRISMFGDEVETIQRIDPLTGNVLEELDEVHITPAKHFVTPFETIEKALGAIEEELDGRIAKFEKEGKLLEAQRLRMRTEYDLEMLKELGFCSGIENYSRFLTGRRPGERPYTLIDFFESDFLTIIDESHATLPQIRGMYNGDRSRKLTLVDHGFRLPSALDNRPLNFEEFLEVTGNMVFVSATPGDFEMEKGGEPVRQVIRPTGIIDPAVEIRPLKNQVDDLMEEVRTRSENNERVLVTTLTKKTAEDLSEYLQGVGLNVKYLHSDIDAIERVEILRALRAKEFDCLVGINLLREGLDLPEVSLVAILDADKEGFLRSETSLIQTAGRAARNVDGKVILYADEVTDSMRGLLNVTEHRRCRQLAYNEEHGITPKSVVKSIQESLSNREKADEVNHAVVAESGGDYDVTQALHDLEEEMLEAAKSLEFERAAIIRDQIMELRSVFNLDPDKKAKKAKGTSRYPMRGRSKGRKNVARKK